VTLYRNTALIDGLSWIAAAWMRFCFATIRWTHVNQAVAQPIWDGGEGVIVAFWHGRIGLTAHCWPMGEAQPVKAMISQSADGQLFARAVERLGIGAVRGSRGNPDKPQKDKGGAQAFRDALRHLRGGALAVTPDGPRGPGRQMGEGLPLLARVSGAPVLFLGASCRPAMQLKSWDRAMLPLPFGRGAVVWDVVHYPAGADVAEVARDWTRRLNTVEARADSLLGYTPDAEA
jgi:lysophospholipid acyltransferase (LPLAT)-like uncharacterized protein